VGIADGEMRHDSQEATAARLRFQVAGAHPPHREVRASRIASSATAARPDGVFVFDGDVAVIVGCVEGVDDLVRSRLSRVVTFGHVSGR
jgi:hypothetical protein